MNTLKFKRLQRFDSTSKQIHPKRTRCQKISIVCPCSLSLLLVYHNANKPGCCHTEPEVKVHPEPEEGRFQDFHLSNQC